MSGLFMDRVLSPREGFGNFDDRILRFRVSFEWTLEGILFSNDNTARRCLLKTQDGDVPCNPGSMVSWRQIPGLWSICPPDGGRELCRVETLSVESLRQWLSYLPHLSPSHALAGMDRIIPQSAFQGELTPDMAFTILDYVDRSLSEGSVAWNTATRYLSRWYPYLERLSLREMGSMNPDSRVVRWLQLNFSLTPP